MLLALVLSYPVATLTGSQLPAEPSRSAPLRGRWPLFPPVSRARCFGESWRMSGLLTGLSFLTMRRIPAAATALTRTLLQDTLHRLRDAEQSPRVAILLPGGDGLLLSPLPTRSSLLSPHIIMLVFLFDRHQCIKLRLYSDYFSFFFFFCHCTGLPTLDSLHLATAATMIRGL